MWWWLVSTTSHPVCGYDIASRARKWVLNTAGSVGAVCTHHAQVLVSVACNPTLLLDLNTGTQIAEMRKAEGDIFGMCVIEGAYFSSILFSPYHSLRPQQRQQQQGEELIRQPLDGLHQPTHPLHHHHSGRTTVAGHVKSANR